MSSAVANNVKVRVDGLVEYILSGKILEAMDEFYSPDIVMQENSNPPTVGHAANVEREKQFLAQVKEWKSTNILTVAVDESRSRSTIQYQFEFVNQQNQLVKYDQVAVQAWKNGKIVYEQFYYDTGAKH